MYYLTTTAGFEPTRDLHNRFQVCLLNHSDKLPLLRGRYLVTRFNNIQSPLISY